MNVRFVAPDYIFCTLRAIFSRKNTDGIVPDIICQTTPLDTLLNDVVREPNLEPVRIMSTLSFSKTTFLSKEGFADFFSR